MASHRVPLVLLAAGIGSRFAAGAGSIKPLAPVGPNHEPLLALALQQASDAGFTESVVVVSEATNDAIRAALTDSAIPVRFAHQLKPAKRTKPFGTVDAVCSAIDRAEATNAIVVANGDDLYGVAALKTALDCARRDGTAGGALIAFPLSATVADGGVSRGVIDVADGRLVEIVEHRDVTWTSTAVHSDKSVAIDRDQLISMNLWTFRPSAVDALARVRAEFVDAHPEGAAELGLPDAVNDLVRSGGLAIDVRPTSSRWHGVTWASDVEIVRSALIAGDC